MKANVAILVTFSAGTLAWRELQPDITTLSFTTSNQPLPKTFSPSDPLYTSVSTSDFYRTLISMLTS